ncbi:MAG: hypothetical protein ACLVJ6_07520 [Merdibacter sp.]
MVLRRSAMHEEILGSDYPCLRRASRNAWKDPLGVCGKPVERLREQLNDAPQGSACPRRYR